MVVSQYAEIPSEKVFKSDFHEILIISLENKYWNVWDIIQQQIHDHLVPSLLQVRQFKQSKVDHHSRPVNLHLLS